MPRVGLASCKAYTDNLPDAVGEIFHCLGSETLSRKSPDWSRGPERRSLGGVHGTAPEYGNGAAPRRQTQLQLSRCTLELDRILFGLGVYPGNPKLCCAFYVCTDAFPSQHCVARWVTPSARSNCDKTCGPDIRSGKRVVERPEMNCRGSVRATVVRRMPPSGVNSPVAHRASWINNYKKK
jgi:hypothetical protein